VFTLKPIELMLMFPVAEFTYVKGFSNYGISLNSVGIDRLERILTMLYVYVVQNSQNFSGLFPSSCISTNTTFRKLDLFPSLGEGGGEDSYLQ
jgi:hypothetical protein